MNYDIKKVKDALTEILKSEAESKIYLFLYLKGGVKSSEIAYGTGLYPSTVRELLAKMYRERIIYREKIESKQAGKNPYVYYAVSPLKILRRFARRMEGRLNSIAKLTKGRNNVRIKVEVEGRL
jgi:predicted DNA-binding transcriptional regulator